jgi:hypothetical protein
MMVDGRQALRRLVKSPGVAGRDRHAGAGNCRHPIFSLLNPTVLRKLSTSAPDTIVSPGTDAKTGAYSSI